jgi:hypothetical protein
MGRHMVALRAAIKSGPRAVLTGWGAEAVPEPGEKHELVKGKASASCVKGNAVRPIGVGAR